VTQMMNWLEFGGDPESFVDSLSLSMIFVYYLKISWQFAANDMTDFTEE